MGKEPDLTSLNPPPAPESMGGDPPPSEFDSAVSAGSTWTAVNIQEALPGLITPLSWSLMSPIMEYAFSRPARRAGVELPHGDPYVARFFSRAYLNVDAIRASAASVPGSSGAAVDEQFFGQARVSARRWRPPAPAAVAAILSRLPRLLWIGLRSASEVDIMERRLKEAEMADAKIDLAALTPAAIVARVEANFDLAREVGAAHIGASGATSVVFEWLGGVTEAWLGDDDGAQRAVLCAGSLDLESARPGKALWDLSRLATRSPAVAAALVAADATSALAALRDPDDAASRAFIAAYDGFIARFGYRCVMETELSAAAWEEDPASVFAMLRGLRDTPPEASPYAVELRQRLRREAATRAALASLSPLKRPILRRLLGEAQKRIATRERTKSLLVRGIHRTRRLLRELDRRFSQGGELAAAGGDLFYLTFAEAAALARGGPAPELRRQVERRRLEEERDRGIVVPESFLGAPRPLVGGYEPLLSGRALKGIAVSPGQASGPARVILDPRADARISPGDILVAPVTDAAWAPLFLTAAAAVVDIGGPLSHGATLARELGLPAVVNVKDGSRLIRDGQRLSVDGRAGLVYLDDADVTASETNDRPAGPAAPAI